MVDKSCILCIILLLPKRNALAGVMELADVLDSKSSGSDTVPVRPRPPAPKRNDNFQQKIVVSFCYFHFSLLVFLFSLGLPFPDKR